MTQQVLHVLDLESFLYMRSQGDEHGGAVQHCFIKTKWNQPQKAVWV